MPTLSSLGLTWRDAFYVISNPPHVTNICVLFRWSSPQEWIEFTRHRLFYARDEIRSSAILRDKINSHLQNGYRDLRHQADVIETLLGQRIDETNDSLYRLKKHLQLVSLTLIFLKDGCSQSIFCFINVYLLVLLFFLCVLELSYFCFHLQKKKKHLGVFELQKYLDDNFKSLKGIRASVIE